MVAVVPACPVAATAPDPLAISGETFSYITFDNQSVSVNAVVIVARDAAGATLASTTSSNAGVYSLSVTGHSTPVVTSLVAQKAGYFTTAVYSDLPFDRAVAGQRAGVFTLGDLPVWDAASMGSVYNTASEAVDPAKGTVNVAVRDCGGSSVVGASVTITPPPKRMFYQNAMGTPSNTMSTTAPYTHAIGLAAEPGPTVFTASAPGLVFPTVQIDVLAGMNNTLVVLHGAPDL